MAKKKPAGDADDATPEGATTMTGTIRGKITDARTRFEDGTQRLKGNIEARKNDLVDRGRKLKKSVDHRTDVAVGKLKDGSLERIYGAGESALRTVAGVVEKTAKLPLAGKLSKPAEKLRHRAEDLEASRDGLQKPPIVGYDGLNVKQVNAALAELSPYELEKARAYEAANKDRVTVLREIDRLLAN